MNEKAKESKVEFTIHPSPVECNRDFNYVTEVSVGRVGDDHPNRYERWEVCIRLPDPARLINTPEAEEYSDKLKEMWGIDLPTALRDYVGGKLSTMPNYHSILGEDKVAPENFGAQCQDLADSYTVGTRATGTGVKVKAQKYDAAEEQAKASGFASFEDALKAMKDKGIIQ